MFINLEYNRSRVRISIQIESKSNGPFLMLSNRLAQVTGFINRDIFHFFSDIRYVTYCTVQGHFRSKKFTFFDESDQSSVTYKNPVAVDILL